MPPARGSKRTSRRAVEDCLDATQGELRWLQESDSRTDASVHSETGFHVRTIDAVKEMVEDYEREQQCEPMSSAVYYLAMKYHHRYPKDRDVPDTLRCTSVPRVSLAMLNEHLKPAVATVAAALNHRRYFARVFLKGNSWVLGTK
jgi:hypothetical protein